MKDRYNPAHECPNCGKPDAGRMMSSDWGHQWSCCSNWCGREFNEKMMPKAGTKRGRKELASLWSRLQSQTDTMMTGEPYIGYKAECQLRALGRL